ncbi:MAG: DeoR/GlpR transcriptional regulator [Verrucomicrobia bacterium]|nr:DeoR/GlpR transcriptional regulator [Verrucomicrobiota bacterium]
MSAETRRRAILEFLASQGNVKVDALSKHFEVSEVTIRKDLTELEEQGLLQRTYGGAVFSHRSRFNAPLLEKLHVQGDQKRAIAQAAVQYIEEGDCIILDAGSTTLAMAQLLASKPLVSKFRSLFIITTSVPAALELSRGGHQILLAGGQVRNHSLALIGPTTVRVLADHHADRAFLGTSGITLSHGYSTPNPLDAEVKQAMIRSSTKSYVLADASKFGHASLARFARLEDIDLTITDAEVSPTFVEAFAKRELPLELAEVPRDVEEQASIGNPVPGPAGLNRPEPS